jgi:hypothetical protein
MLSIDDGVAIIPLNEVPQTVFALNEREMTQVFSIEPEQVECIEHRSALSGEQFVELAYAMFIETYDFTVQDGILNEQFGERFLEKCEQLESVAVTADEFAFVVFDVSQRPEAVVLQFEDVIRVIERLHDSQAHRLDAREHSPV